MDKNSRILIHGAGIAGLTCAIWLGRNGFKPVIVEKSPEIRAAGGFILCLAGKSYRFAEELGILPDLQARNSDINSATYHDGKGNKLLYLDYKYLFEGVDFIQITRDEIENVLYEHAKDKAEYRFSVSAEKINQNNSDVVEVEFSDGSQEEFDLVIGTDGIHSTIRELTFDPSDVTKHYLGLQVAAYKLDDFVGLKNKFEYHMEKDRFMVLYSCRDGQLGCVLVWTSDDKKAPPVEQRWDYLKEQFRDAPKLANKVIEHFPDTSPMLMDSFLQIEMKKWHKGRVVLIGDAAHSLTLLSGQGASSAFADASYLSRALIQSEPEDAFKELENAMHTIVSEMQLATRNVAPWYIPQNVIRQTIRDIGMRMMPVSYFKSYFKNKYMTIL